MHILVDFAKWLVRIEDGLIVESTDSRKYYANLGVLVEFLHRDEFLDKYHIRAHFPAAFVKKEDITLLVDHNEMNSLKTLQDLMDLVTAKVKKIQNYNNLQNC